MTEKEKAKAYDEAIERAKKWHNIPNPIYCNIITEKIFPELKESEDEEIRKEIISILRNAYWTSNRNRFNKLVAWLEKQGDKDKLIQELGEYKVKYTQEVLEKYITSMSNKDDERLRKTTIAFLKDFAEQGYENAVECIDWLEKQGKNSTDKIEPKFNVGDWVIFIPSGSIYQVEKKENYEYTLKNIHGGLLCVSFSNEELIREWTIQDAIDGDILALSWLEDKDLWEKIIIFKKYHSEGVKGICSIPCVEGYGNTFKNGKLAFTEEVPYYSKTWTCNLHPATKEQRDLLLQKIKEAGYKWDTDKKELKKLVEPKFKVGDKIVNVPMKYWGASITQGTISKITEDKYIFTDGSRMSISSQDSWELVSDKKPKFGPKTLQPFDKVLVRDSNTSTWRCTFYSHTREDGSKWKYITGNSAYEWCIPYNDDTKHLVGTTDEAPEYYRYWEVRYS